MRGLNAIIVNYGTPRLVLECVTSILAQQVTEARHIIVVDNRSPDDSLVLLKASLPEGVQIIDAGRNGGFSAGINAGAALATQPLLLVLNPDTRFEDHSHRRAIDLLDAEPDVGLVGLDLVYPDGEPQFSARRFYSALDIVARRTPLGRGPLLRARSERHLMKAAWQAGQPFDADWVMGTGFIVRRELFEAIGRMDEAYFLYMEDVDLCARVWAAGARVVCVPGARLVHDHQRSSSSGPLSWAGRMHLKSLVTYARKHGLPLLTPPRVAASRS
jgi:N-acetylglucosaminyl-diphospho-decaprenol L-rhamnosyltransferase